MIEDSILKLLAKSRPRTKKEIANLLNIKKSNNKKLENALNSLEDEGKVFLTNKKKYRLVDGSKYFYGQIETNRKGYGFFKSELLDRDIYIAKKNMQNALNDDFVIVKKYKNTDERPEGRVVRIVKRENKNIVGTFERKNKFGFVIADEDKFSQDIYISKKDFKGAKDGQKVYVKITKWPDNNKRPEGIIEEVLGYPDEPRVDINSIVKSLDIPTEFREKTLKDAKNTKSSVSEDELEGREDFRNLTTFTIDGAHSKDFDDAISIKKDGENYILGVHIADVSHYVKRNSPMDQDAYERGNSVYLLDSVIPMLPKELSNGICSLNEGVDRLTMSVIIEIDKDGKILDSKIYKAVINSSRRLVYENVSNYLEDGTKHESLEGLYEDLDKMYELAKILQKNRDKRGAIDFEIPEVFIEVDENNWPTDIKKIERRSANRLIEEFMLLANVEVAKKFKSLEIPFMYRIHERPKAEKIEELNGYLRPMDLMLSANDEITPSDVSELIKSVKGKKEELFVSTLTLRAMQKAKYSARNDIHFGLAYADYTHFTSPIRRYCDLTIHRIIKDYLDGRLKNFDKKKMTEELEIIATHVSETEIKAQEAERQVQSVKMAQYMSERIGERYEGIVSSITSFGVFIQLDNLIEGLASYRDMDEFFEFDEEKYIAISRESKKTISIGDSVFVEVVDADINIGNIDFKIVDGKKETGEQ